MKHTRFQYVPRILRINKRIRCLTPPKADERPKILVNTTPKAGTYLVALALEKMGYTPLRLHLADRFFHDNREVVDDEIHYNPSERQVNCRADHVACAMRPGEFCVGHIGDRGILRKVSNYNVHIVNIVRDPLTQLESLYRFEQHKTMSTPFSELWRSMPESARFKGFLMSFDVTSLMRHSQTLINSGPFFCFEDLVQGRMQERVIYAKANSFCPKRLAAQRLRVIADIESGLVQAIGAKTSTYIPHKTGDKLEAHLDAATEAFMNAAKFNEYSKHYRESILSDKTLPLRFTHT